MKALLFCLNCSLLFSCLLSTTKRNPVFLSMYPTLHWRLLKHAFLKRNYAATSTVISKFQFTSSQRCKTLLTILWLLKCIILVKILFSASFSWVRYVSANISIRWRAYEHEWQGVFPRCYEIIFGWLWRNFENILKPVLALDVLKRLYEVVLRYRHYVASGKFR